MSSSEDRCPECGGYRGLPRMLHDQDEPRECSDPFHKSEPPAVIEFPGKEEPMAATEQPQPQPGPRQDPPISPYCAGQMIAGKTIQMGPFELLLIFCGTCKKILSAIQPLQLQQVTP